MGDLKSAWLILDPDIIARCDALAHRRREAAILRGRPAKNNAAQSVGPDILGTRCECAGWLYFWPKCHWHAWLEDVRGKPDLDDFIDVKGRPESWNDLIVQTDDPKDWAYLYVGAWDHPKYHIVGWCWGWEAKTVKITDPRGDKGGPPGPAHFVPKNAPFMKSPGLLFLEQRRRFHGLTLLDYPPDHPAPGDLGSIPL